MSKPSTTMKLVNFINGEDVLVTGKILIDHGLPSGMLPLYNPTKDQQYNLLERWEELFDSNDTVAIIENFIKIREYDDLRTLLGEGFKWVKFAEEQFS